MTHPNAASRPTQAVVLAGGQGSRLRPYTDDRPKPMVEIPGTGTPIIGHQLTWLAEEGVTDVAVSCGHLAEVLQEWLEKTELPVNVTTVVESEPLGRGGGLKYAAKALPRPDEPWYATNGDIWTRFSLREGKPVHTLVNLVGAVAVGFVLVVNLSRGEPIASLVAAVVIAGVLYRLWVKAGRPRGIRDVAAEAEADH